MPNRNITGERLQLLTTFKAIFEQGSIVAAANVQSITQSAVSKHLQKLRSWFDDELFVRTKEGMVPTAKAIALVDQVEKVIYEMEVLNASGHFSPASLTGVFMIAATDDVSSRLLPELLEKLAEQAPNLRLSIIHLAPDYSISQLEMGKVNLVVSFKFQVPEQLMQKHLYSDPFVCLMSSNHPLAKTQMNLQDYADASHIMVAPLGSERGHVDDLLDQQGVNRFIRASVPGFSQVSYELIGDHSIITLPKYIADELCKSDQLVIKEPPLTLSPLNYYLFWHKRYNKENVSVWMRHLIQDILKK